jgi:DsbC/DsbD-like thiol-disulfide interchange protein
MRFPLLTLTGSLLLLLLGGCQESQGGFGKAAIQDPGVNVKATSTPGDAPPDFAGALRISPSYEAGELVVSVALRPGFHAYAPGESIGKPVALAVTDQGGWKAESVLVPEGKTKDLGELGKSQVLEGSFPLKAKVSGGGGALKAVVDIQVCTENACDRPRKHELSVPTT